MYVFKHTESLPPNSLGVSRPPPTRSDRQTLKMMLNFGSWASRSSIEYEPADFVAQLLVVKHEIPDFARKLCTLPLTFQATCLATVTFIGRCACGPDCVGSCTQLMRCHMCHCRSLSGCKSRFPRRSAHHSGCRHGVTGSHSSLRHCDLASRPSARQFDGSMRPLVIGLHFLE
jgi:hypothetical protein